DRRAHGIEVARHRLAQRFRVEGLAEAGRALQVAEEDRDELPHLLRRRGRGQGRPAESTEPELCGVFLAAIGADLHPSQCRPGARADRLRRAGYDEPGAAASQTRSPTPTARSAAALPGFARITESHPRGSIIRPQWPPSRSAYVATCSATASA